MATELEMLKEAIEDGDSWVEALEGVDTDQMRADGNAAEADKVEKVLALIQELSDAAGVNYDD